MSNVKITAGSYMVKNHSFISFLQHFFSYIGNLAYIWYDTSLKLVNYSRNYGRRQKCFLLWT